MAKLAFIIFSSSLRLAKSSHLGLKYFLKACAPKVGYIIVRQPHHQSPISFFSFFFDFQAIPSDAQLTEAYGRPSKITIIVDATESVLYSGGGGLQGTLSSTISITFLLSWTEGPIGADEVVLVDNALPTSFFSIGLGHFWDLNFLFFIYGTSLSMAFISSAFSASFQVTSQLISSIAFFYFAFSEESGDSDLSLTPDRCAKASLGCLPCSTSTAKEKYIIRYFHKRQMLR
ncbi:hypothetical protein Adt_45730 [Abeliophyllum distichum]|uniref:Uncharacterized protein n=1 Tax=Abeliophyllum distichum TaxID=126358 RepID=A0ABD1PEK8_9LAMI